MTCTKQPDGTFIITGIKTDELLEIEEAIIERFNRVTRDRHRDFRNYLLTIKKPVSDALDLHERQQSVYTPKLEL